MPEMDGYQATAELRRREGTVRHTPGHRDDRRRLPEEQARCSRVGMDGFVPKPISPDSLDAALGGYMPAARA